MWYLTTYKLPWIGSYMNSIKVFAFRSSPFLSESTCCQFFSFSITSYYDKSPGKARIAILFSGGIDSTALCYFADRYSSFLFTPLSNCYNRHIPKDEPIDLLNVAFENPRKIRVQLEGNPDALSKHLKRERRKFEQNGCVQQYSTPYLVPDRIGGLEELEELQKVCPRRIWNFVGCNVLVGDQLSD